MHVARSMYKITRCEDDVPPRLQKLIQVAKAEGVAGRWCSTRQLRRILSRHNFSRSGRKNGYQVFYQEWKTVSWHNDAVVAWLSTNLLKSPIELDQGILEFSAGLRKFDKLKIEQDLKFSFGANGVVFLDCPELVKTSFRLVKVTDQPSFDDWAKRQSPFAQVILHPGTLPKTIMSESEAQAILSRPPAIVHFSNPLVQRESQIEKIQQKINKLKLFMERQAK